MAAVILMSLGLLRWYRYWAGDYELTEYDPAIQFLRALWSVHGILAGVAVISMLGLPDDLPPSIACPVVLTTCFLSVVRAECALLSQSFPTIFAVESRLLPEPVPYVPTPKPPTHEQKVIRGRILEKLSNVQRKANQDLEQELNSLPWGGLQLPKSNATLHFAAIGATGSGKSVTLTLLMNEALRLHSFGLLRGSVRGLVYDAKRDVASTLAAIGGTDEVAILNPFDARALAWDIARDITDETSARQVAQTLIPKNERENQPFFNDAARDLVSGAIISLQHLAPERWTLRDLLHAVTSESALRSILSATEATNHYLDQYFEPTTTLQNILSAIATHMAPYRAIAAAWHRALQEGRTFSLNDWISDPRVLILGEDETNRAALAAVNRLIFTRATELLLNQPDRCGPQTWVFLDELRDLGRLDALNRLLLKGRSKNVCVVLGFQDMEGLREVYGEKVANEIVGQCGHYAFLKLNSPTTAEWASQAIGDQEVLETIRHPSTIPPFVDDPKSQQVKTRRVVLPSQILNIEPPQGLSQLTGYYLTASYGLYHSTLSAADIQHLGWLRDDRVPNFVACPPESQVLAPWSEADRLRVGLTPNSESSTRAQSSPRAADVPRESKIPVVPRPAPADETSQLDCNPGPKPATTKPMDIPRVRIDRKKS
ncbi:MAG: type IV secretory system conjugative DNA transfer family protein [Pirellulales bacterium]